MSPFHKEMLTHCTGLLKLSRDKMNQRYTLWDKADEVYRGLLRPDVQDRKAEERGEPIKMIVPLTYSQIQTFLAFCFAMYYQKEYFFELVPMGEEDYIPAKVAQAVLERDLAHNNFDGVLYQFLLDVSRFGLGIVKSGWARETQQVLSQYDVEEKRLFGFLPSTKRTVTELVLKTKYLGNKITSVSPYRFFPDPRLPVSRFQEGEFCASEDEFSWHTLKRMESSGEVIGMDHVRGFTKASFRERGGPARFPGVRAVDADRLDVSTGRGNTLGSVIITEVQVTIMPKKFMVDGKPLGTEDYPVKYNVWIANDQRVVKCEPLNYVHDEYTYDIGEFSPDSNNFVNPGLSETIDQLQSVISWLINSHITSVRKTIQNWLVVDPEKVEMSDLYNRRPVIRMKPGVSMGGIDRYLKQLAVVDVTANHMRDAEELQKVVQLITGINDNALGQFNSGRRSATEARNVNSAAAARLKVPVQLLFKGALTGLARKLVSNLRDGLDEETYVRIIGDNANLGTLAQFKKVTREDLIGEYDFAVFDGTLPSERSQQAQTLQDLVVEFMQVPGLLQQMGYDLGAITKEILVLRGVKHPDRFRIQTVTQPPMMPGMPGMPNATQPTDGGTAGPAPAGAAAGGTPSAGLSNLIAGMAQAGS